VDGQCSGTAQAAQASWVTYTLFGELELEPAFPMAGDISTSIDVSAHETISAAYDRRNIERLSSQQVITIQLNLAESGDDFPSFRRYTHKHTLY
jgi:hypothetical protein